jgi:cardiolipin synthase A/B
MIAAISEARQSVRLETYIYAGGALGERFREALIDARTRGVQVRVLYDALGSYSLSSGFWKPLVAAGGEVRQFNPLSLDRLGIRDHRKVLVCDESVGFVGGFNIAPEYDGDGVAQGWRDVGVRIKGPLAVELAEAFDDMFERADFQHKRFFRLRRFGARKIIEGPNEQLLLSGPGWGRSPIKHALFRDLRRARSVRIIVAYFLPTLRLRRELTRVVRRGGTVQLILAGKSDVAISQLAARSLYRRFLRAGVEIFEYQPQVLHAKLMIINDAVYVGSANLDQRSLNINYEIMVRFEDPRLVAEAREIFEADLKHCRRISFMEWNRSRSFWQRLKQRWAYFLLMRLDPYLAQMQWRDMSVLRDGRNHGNMPSALPGDSRTVFPVPAPIPTSEPTDDQLESKLQADVDSRDYSPLRVQKRSK